jgi:holliday junction DNA helicase RuvA
MFEYIRGKLAEKSPTHVVLDANGVGYFLHISLHTFAELKEEENCRLYTHFVVREDAQILYGFTSTAEREVFRQLISVSGVGPNTARMMLSSASPGEISDAIDRADVHFLQRIKGIGAKTAQRILVDLKGKLSKELITAEKVGSGYNTKKEEALSGLVILGFSKTSAEKALLTIIAKEGTDLAVEELIRHALKIL